MAFGQAYQLSQRPSCPAQWLKRPGTHQLVDKHISILATTQGAQRTEGILTDDLLRDGGGVDMLRVETITQSRHTGGDLVELNAFLASVYARGMHISLESCAKVDAQVQRAGRYTYRA